MNQYSIVSVVNQEYEKFLKVFLKSALEKLNMKKADISGKMNTSQIKEYIRRAKSGQDVNDYLKQFDLKKIELDQLTALMQKRT